MQDTQAQQESSSRPPNVLAELRRQIVRGQFGPNSVLPKRSDLAKRFGAASLTVQRAMNQLRREGFIYVHGRRATYVSATPPHLCRFALIFANTPESGTAWSRFYYALSNEAQAITRASEGATHLDVRYGIDGHADNENARLLEAEVRTTRFAGLMFATPPAGAGLTAGPLVDQPDIPRVLIGSATQYNIPAVFPDTQSLIHKALAYLAQRGRKRVAFVGNQNHKGQFTTAAGLLPQYGMITRPWWMQRIHIEAPDCARAMVQMLIHPNQSERPDGLVILDDNLAEHAAAGIVDVGARVPEELDVVAHCNFPWPTPSVIRMRRLGFDARTVLNTALDLLRRQREGQTVPAVTHVNAIFENENPVADPGESRDPATGT